MALELSYPGVHIEEGRPPRPIEGVPTSVAAFIGRTPQGPRDSDHDHSPTPVGSWTEYERIFGGLAADSTLGYAVQHFFANGGTNALVVRVGGQRRLVDGDIAGPAKERARRGLWALERAKDVNLICIPPLSRDPGGDIGAKTRQAALAYCRQRRAIFIADPLSRWRSAGDVLGADGARGAAFGLEPDANAALYFPFLRAADPPRGVEAEFAPCGAVAGVIARTDAARGVWKAPAGGDADLRGNVAPAVALTEADMSALNPQAVNCLRAVPGRGAVVWGARSWAGRQEMASEWKYLNVRRLGLYLESSIERGTQWAAFEPNGEPTWAALRLSLGTFLDGLFRAGAFQGARPDQAYYVRCDASIHSAADLTNGILHIEIGFAPLRPAEFVVLRFMHRSSE